MVKKGALLLVVLAGPVELGAASDYPAIHNMNTTQFVSTLSKETDPQYFFAVWYLYGFANGLEQGARITGNQFVCPPGGTWTPKQVVAVFLKYANDNPGDWSYSPPALVIPALAKAFPCPGKRS